MAMTNTGPQGAHTISYTQTESYTLEEAIFQSILGTLDPKLIYDQVPTPLRAEIDRLSKASYRASFVSLTTEQRRVVLAKLKEEINDAQNQTSAVTLGEAIKLAIQGKIGTDDLYAQFPKELQDVVNGLSAIHGAKSFMAGNATQRRATLDMLEGLINESQGQTDGSQSASPPPKPQVQTPGTSQSQQPKSASSAGAAPAATPSRRRTQAQQDLTTPLGKAASESAPGRCATCGEPLGVLDRLLGHDRHSRCAQRRKAS